MTRNIGRMGETFFMSLCNSVGIVASSPDEDINGWDYYLEFPDEIKGIETADSKESPIECKIQIKTTDNMDQKSLQIKLSAMLKLVKSKIPTFVCYLHYNGLNNIQEIYLVHIDKDIISKVLKRVRVAELENKKINKQKININYTKSQKFNKNTGEELKKTIESFVPKGMIQYINYKSKLNETVGFKKRSSEITLTLDKSIKKEDIINMAFNKKIIMSVNINSIIEERFNIKAPIFEPLSNSNNVELSFDNKTQHIQISMRKSKYSKAIILDLEMSTMPFLTDYFIFKNDIISIIQNIKSNKITYNININEDKKYKFSDIYSYLKFFNMVIADNDGSRIEIDYINGKTGESLLQGKLECYERKEETLDTELIDSYSELFKKLEITKDINVSINELLKQEKNCKLISDVLNSSRNPSMTLDIEYSGEKKIKKKKFNNFKVFVPISLIFNKKIYGYICEFTCTFKAVIENKIEIKAYESCLFEQFIINNDEFKLQEMIEVLKSRIKNELKYENYFIHQDECQQIHFNEDYHYGNLDSLTK